MSYRKLIDDAAAMLANRKSVVLEESSSLNDMSFEKLKEQLYNARLQQHNLREGSSEQINNDHVIAKTLAQIEFRQLSESLVGNQHKLDHNKDGKIDASDLHNTRKKGAAVTTKEHDDTEEDKKLIKKLVKKDALKEDSLDELSKTTLGSYIKKASRSASNLAVKEKDLENKRDTISAASHNTTGDVRDGLNKASKELNKDRWASNEKGMRRVSGISGAVKRLTKESVIATIMDSQLDEAHKLGDRVMITHTSVKGVVGHVGEIRHGAYKGAPKTYTIDYQHPKHNIGTKSSIQLSSKEFKAHKEGALSEAATDKACWDGYKKMGTKIKNGKTVNNCVEEQFDMIEEMVMEKAAEYRVDPEYIWEDFEFVTDEELLEAAVDAKGHKSATGGLTQKGRDAANRENGSNLQAPVTKKPSELDPNGRAAGRRRSFCARMGGVEGPMKRPNGEPTRKALALKKWNC